MQYLLHKVYPHTLLSFPQGKVTDYSSSGMKKYCRGKKKAEQALLMDLDNAITFIILGRRGREWDGVREVVRKEIKLCFPPTKFTSQEAQGILPLFRATRILKNWDRASSCCLCKWNCSLFHTQWGLNLYAHYLQQQVAVMSPSPWQCWWSQVLEKDQGSPAELHHAPTGQRYVTSPQLIFLSACSHHSSHSLFCRWVA